MTITLRMATTENCPICMDTYTAKTRARVKCQYCPAEACRPCQQRSILSEYEDPRCYSCKAGWSTDFLASNFPLQFRSQTLRHHRRRILFEREKSMLPAMQIFVEAKKRMATTLALRVTAEAVLREKESHLTYLTVEKGKLQAPYFILRDKRHADPESFPAEELTEYRRLRTFVKAAQAQIDTYRLHEYMPAYKAFQTLARAYTRAARLYETGEEGAAEDGQPRERRQFLMRCPSEGCRGFLSTAYACGICDRKTCKECLEVLPVEGSGETHTCKPESVESAKAIRKETRPCPKCGTRIFKIDGCDQMFCTMEGCGTAFSWNSGQVVSGRIHNPHYYEWLRRNGGGTAPREAGDIPCGGIPLAWEFSRCIYQNTILSATEKHLLLEIHRNITEFEEKLRHYAATRPAMDNKDLNVAYLMNELTEAEWQRQLELREAKFLRKKEIGQILQTLVTAAAEILQGILGRLDGQYRDIRAVTWVRESAMPMLESLRVYTNDAFKSLADAQHMAVPQVNTGWRWVGIRALYRKPVTTEAAPAATAAPV